MPIPGIPPFPKGCTITNLRTPGGNPGVVYALLKDPSGKILISADLDYIREQILKCGMES